jgi:hypothetical protein
MIRNFHHEGIGTSTRIFEVPFLRREEPIQPFQQRRLLLVGLGELSSL